VQQCTLCLEIPSHEESSFALTWPLNKRVGVRLYPDCSPHYLETASLQKGLVLILDNHELIEEGMGFGAPVVKYKNKTYFSSTAKLSMETTEKHIIWTKSFAVDTVSRKRFGKGSYVNDRFYRFFHKVFETLYLGISGLFPFFDKIMELRGVMKLQTVFVRVKSKGKITVAYFIKPDEINVQVDLSKLDKEGCESVLLLNEQGASFFKEYSDSNGERIHTFHIGAWEKVHAFAASLSILQGSLKFLLQHQPQSEMYRGWEKTRTRFDWAGLSYSLSPQTRFFDYSIKLTGFN